MTARELDYARELVASAIVAPDHYHDVITVASALTHKIDDVFTAPRILSLGLKGSGKSTILKVAYRLSANACPVTGVKAMTAPSYVADFRMTPNATHCIDELNHLFGQMGENAKGSQFYTYLNQGYSRETAFAQYQENRAKIQIPIFGVVFMAGLGLACPEDMRDRSIILRMEKASAKAEVADFALKQTRDAFDYAGRMLKSWAQRAPRLDVTAVRSLHPELNHRRLEIWGPMFAVALAADGDGEPVWVNRMLVAFERIELNSGVPVYAPDDQILVDYLKFSQTYDVSAGTPSGQFAAWANEQDHGAYAGMKPGQFKQFAVSILGPTTPFYDADEARTVRGWAGPVHAMNLDAAANRLAELEAEGENGDEGTEVWEDF